MLEQQHLNLVVSVMRRLQSVGGSMGDPGGAPPYSPSSAKNQHSATTASSDKLATLMQYLLDCLLTLSLPISGMAVSTCIYLILNVKMIFLQLIQVHTRLRHFLLVQGNLW